MALLAYQQQEQGKQNVSRFEYIKNGLVPVSKLEKEKLPRLERTHSVAAHITMRGLSLSKSVIAHLQNVEAMIIDDAENARFYSSISNYNYNASTLEVVDELSFKIFGQWLIKFDSANAPLRNKFPKVPYLAVDNEIIKMPTCEEGKMATLFWVEATRNGATFTQEPSILEDLNAKRWLLKFNDEKVIDPTSIDKRLMVLAGCS